MRAVMASEKLRRRNIETLKHSKMASSKIPRLYPMYQPLAEAPRINFEATASGNRSWIAWDLVSRERPIESGYLAKVPFRKLRILPALWKAIKECRGTVQPQLSLEAWFELASAVLLEVLGEEVDSEQMLGPVLGKIFEELHG